DGGQEVFAYTAQLGNGVSASISAENAATRRENIYRQGDGFGATFAITNRHAKLIAPDIVGNLRIDQAWGSAQVMAAAHDASGAYYTGDQGSGHPGDKWGWAVGGGIKINLPMIAAGDYVAAQVAYSEGALQYICQHPGCSFDNAFQGGSSFGYGIWTDAVYGATLGDEMQLTTGWGVAAAWEHFWTPSLRTSLHGGYLEVKYNDVANAFLCTGAGISFTAAGASGLATCNNDFKRWQVGSRTQWNVTKQFYMGFDVLYQVINTASEGATASVTGFGGQPTGLRTIEDQDNWAVRARWHRDLP
ncbi:MAG: porin, partial [Xanthobacteraceae bacterium]